MPPHDSVRNRADRSPVLRRKADYWTIAYDAAVRLHAGAADPVVAMNPPRGLATPVVAPGRRKE